MLPFLRRLRERLGPQGYADAADELAPWLTDWRGRVTGKALAMVSPASLEEVRFVVQAAAQEGVPLAPQGGNTSMVAGATPDADGRALLLSMRRMRKIRSVSGAENALRSEEHTSELQPIMRI